MARVRWHLGQGVRRADSLAELNAQRRLIAAWQKNEDWIHHRLLLTPHSAFYTPESFRDNRGFAARTAARFLRDGRLENCVNKQFLIQKV